MKAAHLLPREAPLGRPQEGKLIVKHRNIDRFELAVALAHRAPVLLEALDEAYFVQGHLPGAIALPLARLKEVARTRLQDKSAPLTVYCASSTCQNSEVAAKALSDLGYQNVTVYRGGKADWIEAGLPIEVGPERALSERRAEVVS